MDIGQEASAKKLLAAVDIGSNSIHLIIAQVSQGALRPLRTYRERVQLASGLKSNGHLDAAAFERGLICLRRMGQLLADHNPDVVRVVATHSLRVARNRNEFILLAETALGYKVDVISGSEEARVIFLGVAHSHTLDVPTLVIDIGGGSTELAVGKGFEPEFAASCAMGCVSFRDRFFHESLDKSAFSSAQEFAAQQLEAYLPRLEKLAWQQVFTTSGTAKALDRLSLYLHQQNGKPNDETELPRSGVICRRDLKELKNKIVKKGLQEFESLSLGAERLPLIPGGLAIMLAVTEALNVEQLLYTDVALREGVLYELDDEMRHPDIAKRTRESLHERYQVDVAHAQRVADCCQWMLDNSFGSAHVAKLSDYTHILIEAAQLHEVGLQVNAGGLQKHSYYILQHSDLPGFSQENQLLLAQLVLRYRKRLNLTDLPVFAHLDKHQFLLLALVLRLAIIFNTPRKPMDLSAVALNIAPDSVSCRIQSRAFAANTLLESDLRREKRYLAEAGVALHIEEC